MKIPVSGIAPAGAIPTMVLGRLVGVRWEGFPSAGLPTTRVRNMEGTLTSRSISSGLYTVAFATTNVRVPLEKEDGETFILKVCNIVVYVKHKHNSSSKFVRQFKYFRHKGVWAWKDLIDDERGLENVFSELKRMLGARQAQYIVDHCHAWGDSL